MSSGLEKRKPLRVLLLAGFGLLAMAFLAPDATHQHNGSFVKLAVSTSWQRLFELAPAWCCFKIICLSIGLFLIFESIGTLLARWKRREIAVTLFSLQIVPALGCLAGSYFLLKALL